MGKVKSWLMDLEDEFYDRAAKVVEDSETISEALKRVEFIRKHEYNWMDEDDVSGMVEDFWSDYWSKYA